MEWKSYDKHFLTKKNEKWANLIYLNQKTSQAHLNIPKKKTVFKSFLEKKSMKKNAYNFHKWKSYDKPFFHRTHAWNCMISIFLYGIV